jgi:hypothetical protein
MQKLRRSIWTVAGSRLWAVSDNDEVGSGQIAAPCTFRREGRIPDLRCKCEVGVRQQRELTFRLPKNSVSFCTAARPLRALFN